MTNQKTPVQGGATAYVGGFSREQVSAAAVAYNSFPRNYLDLSDLEKHEVRIKQALEAAASIARPTPVQGGATEEQIEAATWALIDSDTDVADHGVSDEHYRERRAEVERIAPILALSAPTSADPADERHDAEERQGSGVEGAR
ncbi:hypothetical protein ACFWHR_07565 [Leucobacter sp. NPDC058333]|uniref:hypothetical protein n=1 Tax=Leucobacter sp. NPDC058333 TaxID=3346450 RepID=UPI0036676CC8